MELGQGTNIPRVYKVANNWVNNVARDEYLGEMMSLRYLDPWSTHYCPDRTGSTRIP